MSFSESNLAKKFTTVANTQDSVQTLSLWLLHHRAHHRKIVDTWIKVLKKSKAGHRLTMLYLANDVLQNGKRKGVPQFVEAFGDVLPDVIELFKDERIIKQVDRVFSIWGERSVFPTEYTAKLKDTLHGSSGTKDVLPPDSDGAEKPRESSKKNKQPHVCSNGGKPKQPDLDKIILEFKPQKVIDKIKKLKKVENESNAKLATLTSRNMDASSSEVLRKFKDRSHGQQFQKDFDEATKCLEEYIQALEKEVEERTEMVNLLGDAKVYYENQHGEARIVATAYKNFGNRVKSLKKKLETRVKTLPSPVPSPTPDAPSPTNSDDGLQLPQVQEAGEPDAGEPDTGVEEAGPAGSPNSAPSPEGSPVGLSPVAPDAAAATTGSASGSSAALSSFMSQSPSVLSSWLDAFNQEFQESRINDPPPVLAPAAPTPSTLESRLSTLMENFGNIPGGLFSTSSASNTPKRADSPPSGSARPAPPVVAAATEQRSGETPIKDEGSGQGTPVLDENSFLSRQGKPRPELAPNSARADVDLRPAKVDVDARVTESCKAKPVEVPIKWEVNSPKTSTLLVPPPIPPALQAYLEPIQTVTSSGATPSSSSGRPAPSPPAPSADYLIPVAENFDVTDMELDDDSPDDEAVHLAHKKTSNLITLVQPEESGGTPDQSAEKEPCRDEGNSTPSEAAPTAAGGSDPRKVRAESTYAAASKIETVQTRAVEDSGSQDLWERREYYPPPQQNGGGRMRGRGFYGYGERPQRGGYQESYGQRRPPGRYGQDWNQRPPPRFQNFSGPPHRPRGPYFNPRY